MRHPYPTETEARDAASEEDLSSAAALLGRKGGAANGARKAAASRANGKRGGRPVVLTARARAFADACHTNAVDELTAALAGPVDRTDCRTWRITPGQWRLAIRTALAEARGPKGGRPPRMIRMCVLGDDRERDWTVAWLGRAEDVRPPREDDLHDVRVALVTGHLGEAEQLVYRHPEHGWVSMGNASCRD